MWLLLSCAVASAGDPGGISAPGAAVAVGDALLVPAAEGIWRLGADAVLEDGAYPFPDAALDARDGQLVVAGRRRSQPVMRRGADGAWTIGALDGLPKDIRDVLLLDDGSVLAAAADGLHVCPPGDGGWRALPVEGAFADLVRADADIWAVGRGGTAESASLVLLAGGSPDVPQVFAPQLPAGLVAGWFDAAERSLWVVTSDGLLARLAAGDPTFVAPAPLPVEQVAALVGHRDEEGLTLAALGADAAVLYRDGEVQRRPLAPTYPPSEGPRGLGWTSSGLWVAAGGHLELVDARAGWKRLRPPPEPRDFEAVRWVGLRLVGGPALRSPGARPAAAFDLDARVKLGYPLGGRSDESPELGVTPVLGVTTGFGPGADALGSAGVGVGPRWPGPLLQVALVPRVVAGRWAGVPVVGARWSVDVELLEGAIAVVAGQQVLRDGDAWRGEVRVGVGADLVSLFLLVGLYDFVRDL